jgi:DeoR/GlpR family transcriptional regulator of sugar metabolism
MSLTTHDRRDRILRQILDRGHVTVRALVEDMAVSEATVRRDLRSLADSHQLELIYGGATLPRTADLSLQSKAQRNVEAKRRIGRQAAELVRDHEMLFIDSGTTAFEMCAHLKMKRALTVITNSARVAAELGSVPDINLILVGGKFRTDRMDTVGPLATNAIEQMRGYMAFVGADGLGPDFGVTANDMETAHLYQHVIRNARESILLVDHDKFLRPSLFRICGLEAVSRVVSDQPPRPEWEEILSAKGIEVLAPDLAENNTTAINGHAN